MYFTGGGSISSFPQGTQGADKSHASETRSGSLAVPIACAVVSVILIAVVVGVCASKKHANTSSRADDIEQQRRDQNSMRAQAAVPSATAQGVLPQSRQNSIPNTQRNSQLNGQSPPLPVGSQSFTRRTQLHHTQVGNPNVSAHPSQSTHVGPASIAVSGRYQRQNSQIQTASANSDRADCLLFHTGASGVSWMPFLSTRLLALSTPIHLHAQHQFVLLQVSGDSISTDNVLVPPQNPALPDVNLDMQIERDAIEVDRTQRGFLGKGGFATVYRGTYQ